MKVLKLVCDMVRGVSIEITQTGKEFSRAGYKAISM